ncbi:tRNA-splicing endonuclease-like protein [Periconia macrospinosa]|uniref:tRNA-splicing endonuclease-like protein n=1 Tax=Periconia macrospinosa TaxID=97972 RepID=A0A2V1DPY2_9PLEO|nr:tRNA-splicing endonuclease-like protein [Periconia macrospinosa]
MADIVERINELKILPQQLHLFCPRTGPDDGEVYFDEDIANIDADNSTTAKDERKLKVEEAEKRKWITLEALQILAYDGDEAAPHKTWLLTKLNGIMSSCDVCVRIFHSSRGEWKARLVENFDEEMVHDFLRVVDDHCLDRIHRGLAEANSVLQNADPKQRGVRILPDQATYAFFEGLSCDALIRNEELLQRHFDTPFKLVQTKKRLKLQTYLPAMTRFLFSRNETRQQWAAASWGTFKRNILMSEFEWTVRDHLVDAMMKVQMTALDLAFVAPFWRGVSLIIKKSDKDIITNCIRGLDGNFYRLLLDHLSLGSEGFLDLIVTMRLILEKSPADFWDAMDAISAPAATVVEQVFNSPFLRSLLRAATDENEQDIPNLVEAFSWIPPFLASIKPTNLTPAVRAFANALFGRLQSDQFSRVSRAFCFREGLRALDYAFKRMCEGKQSQNFVGQPTVNAMLDVLKLHIQVVVTSLKRLRSPETREDLQLALSMIQHAFTLEALSTSVEKQLIQAKQPSPNEVTPSRPIWETIIKAIDSENIDVAIHLLIAGRTIIGLEPIHMKKDVPMPTTVKHFNDRFELLSRSITDVAIRLADFHPQQLGALFNQPAAASAIISLLFSSTEDTRSAAIELLKVISSQDERRDALQYILRSYYKYGLVGIADSCNAVKRRRTFAAAPSMMRTCTDIIDVMCHPQDGILRSRQFDAGEASVTLNLWKSLWDALTIFFATTEGWSNLGIHDKEMMMNFCRDVMQFADNLFDQCSIFASALGTSNKDDDNSGRAVYLKKLLEEPAKTMDELKKWLRLRDEYLSTKSVTLISKLLVRLRDVQIELQVGTLDYMESVLTGGVRARLSMQQQAELQRALEIHLGRSLVKEEEQPTKEQRQGSLSEWMSTGMSKGTTKDPTSRSSSLLAHSTPTMSRLKESRELAKVREAQAAKSAKLEEAKNAAQNEFKRKRQLELERAKKEKEAAIAKARKERGLTSLTSEAGSGLDGIGILGKDQAPKGEGLMHSSDESDDDEGDFDEELFGITKPKLKVGPKTNIVNEIKIQMPVRKRKIQRSFKDMRARLIPDLSFLHKTILGWDYFHQGDFPPKSKGGYATVLNKFQSPQDYQATFKPLLTLEAWQGFVKAREENQGRPYEVRIVARSNVDAFLEVSSTMTQKDLKDAQVMEGDVILLHKSKSPSAQDPHCLARVFRVQRKKAHVEVSYRVIPGNPLIQSLVPNGSVFGTKIQSLTPLEREYGALEGLQYYDLCDEIVNAKPSPLLTYKEKDIDPLIKNYSLNQAQAKAVKSAIDNDAFTLIQGPPGSGKTKTIVAIVGAVLSESFRNRGTGIQIPGQARSDSASKKLLVCAPSNAAVDELVMRFKNGIKTVNGEERKANIVRLGRSDNINTNVQDVVLDNLVSKKLGLGNSNEKDTEATRKLFADHKQISEQLRIAQDQMATGEIKGADASRLQEDISALRRQKALLGTKIDNTKDAERTADRNAELNRRRAQQQVLDDAHIICATLSGSGHEMFQGLNIEFETVVVDEAAQCVEMSALIPLKYGCSKCILVGDPKQLPPTVFSKEAAKFQYEQSLFVRMQKNHPKDVHLLDTQYRMHPEISLFPSQTFYDGRLLDGGDMAALRKSPWHKSLLLGPYRFFDVQGHQQAAGHSLINIAEINIALQLYRRLTSDFPSFDFRNKIGIITPYKSQLRELKDRFVAQFGASILDEIDFNTTDAFQGRESEIIIFSCVRASPAGGIGFLQDIRRMNVGLTRAKSSLFVLGNSQSLIRGQFWRKLVDDAKTRDRYTGGDVSSLLKQPSSKFPAPPGIFDVQTKPAPPAKQEVKSENMSRSNSNQSGSSSGSDHYTGNGTNTHTMIKQEIKEEFIENADVANGYGKRKLEDGEDDVEMEDASSETASKSGTSTPVQLGSGNDEIKKGPQPATTSSAVPNLLGGTTKPKIRRRVKGNDPLLAPRKRPKH